MSTWADAARGIRRFSWRQEGGARYGIEVKYSGAPGVTKSMRVALHDLDLRKLFVEYPGRDAYDLDKRVTVIPLEQIRARLPFPKQTVAAHRIPRDDRCCLVFKRLLARALWPVFHQQKFRRIRWTPRQSCPLESHA